MKKKIFTAICIFSILFSSIAYAQPMMKTEACNNASIIIQADSMKSIFEKQGFMVMKEASLNMDSEYEFPIIVPLRERSLYHIIFIGDMSTKIYEMRIFDSEDNKVFFQKKMWGDVDGNIIQCDIVPRNTQLHMIKPVQVNKKKNSVCGYMILMKKVR